MGQCATSEISFIKRNKLNVPTLILSPVKQFPPQMRGLTSQRTWGRRCRRSPERCGDFDPSLSLRNYRTGLSKIPFVKTYVVCFYSGILYVSQGAEIYLYRPSSRNWLMLAIISFCGRSGCFSDAAYYTRWLTSPLPSWTTSLLPKRC